MLIPSDRQDRLLGTQADKLGLNTRANINRPSRLASRAAGQPLGMSYIPPLPMPDDYQANLGGGSPESPGPSSSSTPTTSTAGKKNRPPVGDSKLNGM